MVTAALFLAEARIIALGGKVKRGVLGVGFGPLGLLGLRVFMGVFSGLQFCLVSVLGLQESTGWVEDD